MLIQSSNDEAQIIQMLVFVCQPMKHIGHLWPKVQSECQALQSSHLHREQFDLHFELCLIYEQSPMLFFLSLND